MLDEKLEVRARRDYWYNGVAFLIKLARGNGVVKSLTLEKIPEGETCDPTFKLDYTEAQQLMDELWACGIRPTEGAGSAGAMAAVQKHLEDMRALVFNKEMRVTLDGRK